MITKKCKNLVLLLVAITLLVAACKPEEEITSPLSAGLSELQGIVEMKQAGEDEFYSADPDSTMEVDGQIQTGDDGKVRLDLSTGTILRVSPSSLFTLVANEEVVGGLATKLKLEFGRVFIGDNVNLAARIQDLTKTYKWPILVSEATYQQVKEEFECELVDSVVVKGKTEAVNLYSIRGAKGTLPDQLIQPWKTL